MDTRTSTPSTRYHSLAYSHNISPLVSPPLPSDAPAIRHLDRRMRMVSEAAHMARYEPGGSMSDLCAAMVDRAEYRMAHEISMMRAATRRIYRNALLLGIVAGLFVIGLANFLGGLTL